MNRLPTWIRIGVMGLASAVVREHRSPAATGPKGQTENRTVLGIQGTRFTLNGKPTFLLGISYYGGLGAPEGFLRRDLDDLQRHGFTPR